MSLQVMLKAMEEMAAKRPPKPLKPEVRQDFDVIKQCQCGSGEYWLPVGHRDIASSYRCFFCSPPPSPAIVQQKITVKSGVITPPFSYTFTVLKRVCKRCAARTVTMDQNGYHCGSCSAPISDEEGYSFWEFDEQDREALFNSTYRKHTRKDVELIINKKKLPLVLTNEGKYLPVDVLGFIDIGLRRETMQPRPSDDDIRNATSILRSVFFGSGNGDKKRVSTDDIIRIMRNEDRSNDCTPGGMIVAASNLQMRIYQNESYSEINVSRGWWNRMNGRSGF